MNVRAGSSNRASDSPEEFRPMTFHATTRWGGDAPELGVERLREIHGQLDAGDDEHASVSLTHESERCPGAFPGGLLTREIHEADDEPGHINGVSRSGPGVMDEALAAYSTRSNRCPSFRGTRSRNSSLLHAIPYWTRDTIPEMLAF
jgi:hypothetical protein